MGQVYNVIISEKMTDEKKVAETLRMKIERGKSEHVDYSLDHYKAIGIGTDTAEDLMKIFFGGWMGRLGSAPLPDGFTEYTSDFDTCYGWERIMMEAFDEIAPYLADGSKIVIYPDSGADIAVVKGGKAEWS